MVFFIDCGKGIAKGGQGRDDIVVGIVITQQEEALEAAMLFKDVFQNRKQIRNVIACCEAVLEEGELFLFKLTEI